MSDKPATNRQKLDAMERQFQEHQYAGDTPADEVFDRKETLRALQGKSRRPYTAVEGSQFRTKRECDSFNRLLEKRSNAGEFVFGWAGHALEAPVIRESKPFGDPTYTFEQAYEDAKADVREYVFIDGKMTPLHLYPSLNIARPNVFVRCWRALKEAING
jgi:hypothetical protein